MSAAPMGVTGAMNVIGVTGLPCSGKSFAAGMLAEGGVDGKRRLLLKADDIGHAVLERPAARERLRARFGDAALADPAPAAVRRAVAARVFASPEDLLWLEGLVHPLVREEIETALRSPDAGGGAVVEAALLFAGGLQAGCDRILIIEAPFETRLARARERGWDEDELTRRERRQLPLFEAARAGPYRDKLATVANDADAGTLRDGLLAALGG